MDRRVLLATGNHKKLEELRRLVIDADIEVVGLADVAGYPAPVEDDPTFEGNALIKARAAVAATGIPSLADDSGLEVDVLNKMPGVRSARWSGPDQNDDTNNALLLAQLFDVPVARRRARFVCAVALVLPDGREHVERATFEGVLIDGFGYDPLFLPEGQTQTSAELTAARKDEISHRGKAMRAIVPVLIGRSEGVRS